MLDVIGEFGYLGVALLIFTENIFPPIPSEVVLLFGGYITLQTTLNPWFVIISASIASVLGAMVLYFIGYFMGKERLKLFFSGKIGRLLGFGTDSIDKADSWFRKYEYKAVLICRCIPIVRSIISIPAGISKMSFLPFIVYTLIGSSVWNTLIVWLGILTGDAWKRAAEYLGIYSKIILISGVILLFLILFIRKRKKSACERRFTENSVSNIEEGE